MRIIIVGGGKIGYYLTKALAQNNHQITVIETQKDLCYKICNDMADYKVSVINGDGTNLDCLNDANIEKANVFIAVTGKDEENLAACQMAKLHYNVPQTIARVNNPKNIKVFECLGVDSVVSSTAFIADLIDHRVEPTIKSRLNTLSSLEYCIKDIHIPEKSLIQGKIIKDLELPPDSILVAVFRNNEVLIPNGQTVIEQDDVVVVFTKQKYSKQLLDYLEGRGDESKYA